MYKSSRVLGQLGAMVGLEPKKFVFTVKGLPFFIRDYVQLEKQMQDQSFPFGRPFPCLTERFGSSGDGRSLYFQQDLFVAQRVFLNNPLKYVDVGSRVDGFVAHLATFRKIKVFDITVCCSYVLASLLNRYYERPILNAQQRYLGRAS